MLPEVGRWQEEHAQKLTLALISRGEVEENKTKAQEHGLTNVLLQKDWEVSESYEVRGTPSAVLIATDGKIASPVAGGAEGIRALLSYAVGERAQLPMQPHQPQTEGQPCPNCGKVHAAAPTVAGGPEGRRGGPRGEAARPRRQHRGASRLQGRRDPGALLEPRVRLLPADAPRPKGVGGKPSRGRPEAAGRLGRLRGGKQGDGARLPGAAWTSSSPSDGPSGLRARPLRCWWTRRAR